MKRWLSKKLVRFVSNEDFIEHIREKGSLKEKREILTQAVKRLFNTVSADDILKETPEGTMFEGKILVQAQTDAIKEHAKSFVKSKLFQVLDKEVRYHCNLRMSSATNLEQLDTAKSIQYTWDIIKTRLKKF